MVHLMLAAYKLSVDVERMGRMLSQLSAVYVATQTKQALWFNCIIAYLELNAIMMVLSVNRRKNACSNFLL